jgi:hypothetical protein
MKVDPIVEEVRNARYKLAKECQFNVRKIFAGAKVREANSGHRLVSFVDEVERVCEDPAEYKANSKKSDC